MHYDLIFDGGHDPVFDSRGWHYANIKLLRRYKQGMEISKHNILKPGYT
jgi:hypothetical protein